MKWNLSKIVVDYVKSRPEEKFTARQIAEWVFVTYPDECQAKKNNSQALETDADLVQQLVREISSQMPRLQKNHLQLKTSEGRPRKFYYSLLSDSDEVAAVENEDTALPDNVSGSKISERALYPLLSQYLWKELGIYSMRIDEKRSSNKRGANYNRWLHPDMVGLEDLGEDWHHELRECVRHYFDKRTKLWSFEVKLLINRANVRECFFQTVSNSSWANFGYLVAAQIVGQDTLKEMRMLSAAHGIGLIKLEVDNPADSQVLIPAREREDIDWDMANRLTIENRDFLEYVKLVKQFYQTGEARVKDWDIPETED